MQPTLWQWWGGGRGIFTGGSKNLEEKLLNLEEGPTLNLGGGGYLQYIQVQYLSNWKVVCDGERATVVLIPSVLKFQSLNEYSCWFFLSLRHLSTWLHKTEDAIRQNVIWAVPSSEAEVKVNTPF